MPDAVGFDLIKILFDHDAVARQFLPFDGIEKRIEISSRCDDGLAASANPARRFDTCASARQHPCRGAAYVSKCEGGKTKQNYILNAPRELIGPTVGSESVGGH